MGSCIRNPQEVNDNIGEINAMPTVIPHGVMNKKASTASSSGSGKESFFRASFTLFNHFSIHSTSYSLQSTCEMVTLVLPSPPPFSQTTATRMRNRFGCPVQSHHKTKQGGIRRKIPCTTSCGKTATVCRWWWVGGSSCPKKNPNVGQYEETKQAKKPEAP